MEQELVVRTENLTKEFKTNSLMRRRLVKALDNLNLQVKRSEIFGYLGPNGAGKTTTFKLLLGLIFPSSGAAWVLGKPINEVNFKRRVGFLPEQPYFYDYLTGAEFLDFYAQLFRFDKKARKQKVRALLEAVGLEEAASLQLRKFSRGMLQRIGIAQTLINDPELVILDEPLSGLDPVGRKEVRDIIFRLKDEGRTVVFSSHILSDVEAICDRVGILMQGKLQRVECLDEFSDLEVESVEMTVSGLDEIGVEAILTLGGQVIRNGGRTVIAIHGVNSPDGEIAIVRILAAIRESDAKLVSMTSRTRSLEDLFMGLNGHAGRYDTSPVRETGSLTVSNCQSQSES
jgi:ABC-2 type transport system ATP-binding protein